MKRIFLIASASIWIVPATLCAAQASLGWPEVIALLTKARTQATTCVEVLKSSGDKAALASARLTYGMAEGEMDGVIAGLTTALVEGGDPDRLPTVRTSLETSGKGLKEICDAAVKTITPNTKGVWEEIAKGAVEPLIQGDFRRRRRALDAPCRKGQARTRDEEVPVGGREMAQVWQTSPRNSRRPFSIGRCDLRAGPRAGSRTEEGDGPVRPPGARRRSRHAHCQDLITSRRRRGALRSDRLRRSHGEDLVGRRWKAVAHDLDSGRA